MEAPRPLVLVVEDEPILRMDTVAMVEEAGLEAIGAANAAEAIDLLESRSDIGVIITDIEMPPGMDGLALVALVRRRWPPIAVIVISGQVTPLDGAIPEGGEFLNKPFNPADLIAALKRIAA